MHALALMVLSWQGCTSVNMQLKCSIGTHRGIAASIRPARLTHGLGLSSASRRAENRSLQLGVMVRVQDVVM